MPPQTGDIFCGEIAFYLQSVELAISSAGDRFFRITSLSPKYAKFVHFFLNKTPVVLY